ncbi:polymorphic toxin-type HINT domain-containing protein, partial [Winogradskyella sp. 3972H.M.0a.05]|uniref:polymorphic toxin-type HINT domain-containing protein n=1 Tax=Winogradskyella sp. 3972H.M.0a.05 TaxID=2950277 RepID=UPI003394F2A4
YRFRMHDPRIGRFFAIDPLSWNYPELTPYQFSSNTTIAAVELEGLEADWKFDIFYAMEEQVKALDNGASHEQSLKVYRETLVMLNRFRQMPDEAVGVMADFTPGLGDLKGLVEVFTNKDLVTGEELGGWRYLGLIGLSELRHTRWLGKISEGSVAIKNLKVCGCFTSGTQIYTKDGYKDIKDIKVGDFVWAYDDETRDLALKEVTDTFTREYSEVYKIYFADEVVEATNEHPFFIGGKWLEVRNLKQGDLLTLYNGSIVTIDKIERTKGLYKVYNFTVKDYHTYYVSKQNVLVHNGNPCSFLNKSIVDKMRKITVDPDQAKNFQPDGKTLNFTIEDDLIMVDGKAFTGNKDFVITNEGALQLGNGHYHLSGNADSVKGAGEVAIVNGKITDVSTNSGHYKPLKGDATSAAEAFKDSKIASDDILPFNGALPWIDN